MKALGRIIKCMAGESCSMKKVDWPMKDIGAMMSSMDMERFTTITRFLYKVRSTIPTSTCLMISGSTIRELWSLIPRKVEARSN